MTAADGSAWTNSLVFPIAVWVAQQLVTGAISAYRWLKRQDFLYTNILEEIRRTRTPNAVFRQSLNQALAEGIIADRLAEDPRYFVFVVMGDSTPSVFPQRLRRVLRARPVYQPRYYRVLRNSEIYPSHLGSPAIRGLSAA